MSPSPIVSQISTLEVSVSVTAGVTLTSLPAVPPKHCVPHGSHWRGFGAEQLCTQPASQPAVVTQCSLHAQIWVQFPSGCDGTDVAVPLSGVGASALCASLACGDPGEGSLAG